MKYLITGGFGYGSLGDELILSSELDIFNRNNCTVVSYDPKETTVMHEINSIPYTMKDVLEFDNYDCLIIGGGAVFVGGWVRKHYIYAINAIEKGKEVVVFNVGVMDDVEDWYLAKKIFEMSSKFTVRSKASYDSFKNGTGYEPAIDGFYSKSCKKVSKKRVNEILNNAGVDANKILIGIQCKNVGHVIDYYIPICRDLLSHDNVELVEINTCIHKIDIINRDNLAIDIINSELEKEKSRLIKRMSGDWYGMLHPHEMKALLAELEYLIANRKHPALAAESEGVKVLLVDNDGAIARVKDNINNIIYVDINIDNNPNKLISMFKEEIK